MSSHEDVLGFWFDNCGDIQSKIQLWFGGGPTTDATIRRKFGNLIERACCGELSDWVSGDDPRKALAFVILIDQFCRNCFRGTVRMFQDDHRALSVAEQVIRSGKYKELRSFERYFLYLPLMHDENMESQKCYGAVWRLRADSDEFASVCEWASANMVKCVRLFEELVQDADSETFRSMAQTGVEFAMQHKDVIEKYGRYPKRNAVLGRSNTAEEEEVLKNWPYKW